MFTSDIRHSTVRNNPSRAQRCLCESQGHTLTCGCLSAGKKSGKRFEISSRIPILGNMQNLMPCALERHNPMLKLDLTARVRSDELHLKWLCDSVKKVR